MNARGRMVCAALALSLSAASSAAAQATCHDARVDGDVIHWSSFGSLGVPLVLPRELESIQVEDGVLRDHTVFPRDGHRARITAIQPIVDRADVTLRPPRGSTPQRIVFRGYDAARFDPRFDGALERRLGLIRGEDVSREDLRQLDYVCGPPPSRAERIYLSAGSVMVRGEIHTRSERRSPLLLIGVLVLLGCAVIGARAYRNLAQRAALERADALIDERFESLGRDRVE